jgi:predicted ATP-dependent endonuclease of OLD family
MQIQEIRLTNFKCFKSVKIQCSKFTLLTGANSSGKSSVLHGLLGAVQTKDFPLYFSPNGTYVSMGDFEELAYHHSRRITFGVGLSLMSEKAGLSNFDCTYGRNPKTGLPKLRTLDYSSPAFSLRARARRGAYAAEFVYEPNKKPGFSPPLQDVMKRMSLGFLEVEEKRAHESVKKAKDRTVAKKMIQMMYSSRKREGSFRFKDSAQLFGLPGKRSFLFPPLMEMNSLLRTLDERLDFISSFRLSPERTYYQKTKAALKVDKYGDNAIDQIVEWEQAKAEEHSRLKQALVTLHLATELRSKKYAGGRYDIRVVPSDSNLPSSLCDVGFGVSQFLPILVADLQMGKGSTLVVSQPEIHLHPSVQAALANYFCKQSDKFEKRYILETHSEYLISRFRLLVAKGELKEDDVSAYYFSPRAGRPVCHRLRFRKNGRIEGAPEDFFSTYMMDAMDIAMNA